MYGYGGWPPYVTVAEKLKRGRKAVKRLAKKNGFELEPIEIKGRKITREFWGQAWCDHIEGFSDYESRLDRGKRYVRNGSVVHLSLSRGQVLAYVCGSELYQVDIAIKPMTDKAWQDLKRACRGGFGSVLELLQGKISESIMGHVTDPKAGLFPADSEVNFDCSCPDYAEMCKHVAAVFYGVGARLDSRPECLFELRGVDPEELFEAADTESLLSGAGQAQRLTEADDLSALFGGVDFGAAEPVKEPVNPKKKPAKSKKSGAKAKGKVEETASASKEIYEARVARIIEAEVGRALYALREGPWRCVKDLSKTLTRRKRQGQVTGRHKVWYYLMEAGDDAKRWLDYARRQEES